MKRKIAIALTLIFSLALSLIVLSGCDMSGKTVPVYRGMSISSYMKSASATSYMSDGKDDFDYDKDNGNHNGHFKGDSTDRDETVDEENPFPDNEEGKDIEYEVDSSLIIIGPAEKIYYATPGEYIYINIYIENPDNFEILSFTLNGQKYSSYMFEEGSDMENIVLKYNVGTDSGIKEYTIDAIKYVDGTAIKDVTIGGDRTVTAGVRVDDQVVGEILSADAGTNNLDLEFSVTDDDGLIAHSNGFIKAVLYDGERIVAMKDLTLGTSSCSFEGLKTNTLYQYALVAHYNDLSGIGARPLILDSGALYTDPIVLFDEVTVGTSAISFTYLWNETHPTKTISDLWLYHDGGIVLRELTGADLEVDNLLSGTAYTLVAQYANGESLETISLDFVTAGKSIPSFAIDNLVSTDDTVNADITVTDTDDTLIDYTVSLYKGESLVATNASGAIDFSSLEDLTEYSIQISFTYDLDDGEGEREGLYKSFVTTKPYIDITSCTILNSTSVSVGETVYMQINAVNPHNLRVASVVVNGNTYNVTGSSGTTKIYVEIRCDEALGGGETTLTPEKINLIYDFSEISVTLEDTVGADVFINGALSLERVELVDENFEPLEWALPGDTVYALLTFDNPTGYVIDSVNGNTTDLTRLDDDRWYYSYNVSAGWRSLTVSSISYHNDYVTKLDVATNVVSESLYMLQSAEPVYISTPDELKNMGEGRYYVLTSDIDLAGLQWIPSNFQGVFIGNGYSIKNMTFVGTLNEQTSYLGLFAIAGGIIDGVNIEGATIIASLQASNTSSRPMAYYGGIAAATSSFGEKLSIYNCSIDENSSVSVRSDYGDSFVGGIVALVGMDAELTISGCTNSAAISATANLYTCAGGLVAKVSAIGSRVNIDNSANYGAVSAASGINTYAAGIVAYIEYEGRVNVTNVLNAAPVNTYGDDVVIGGILGYASSGTYLNVTSSLNIGILDADTLNATIGGIIGWAYDSSTVTDCYSVIAGPGGEVGGIHADYEELDEASFYTDTLGWSLDIWELSELDTENGVYPTLK